LKPESLRRSQGPGVAVEGKITSFGASCSASTGKTCERGSVGTKALALAHGEGEQGILLSAVPGRERGRETVPNLQERKGEHRPMEKKERESSSSQGETGQQGFAREEGCYHTSQVRGFGSEKRVRKN